MLTTDALCFQSLDGQASTDINGGTPPYIEDWGANNPSALSAGLYSVNVTDDNGCGQSENFIISEPDLTPLSKKIFTFFFIFFLISTNAFKEE